MSAGISTRRVSDFISPAYLEEQRILHAAPRGYGGKGNKWASVVADLALEYKASSILDYGAGRGTLIAALQESPMFFPPYVRFAQYDPAVPSMSGLPSFADLVTCTDCLEHVEPDRLDSVLEHLKFLARKAVFVVIATRPSNKTLSDGRNAHLIIEQDAWWAARLGLAGFTITYGPKSPSLKPSREFVAILTP